MTRVAVGSRWDQIMAAQRAELTQALRQLSGLELRMSQFKDYVETARANSNPLCELAVTRTCQRCCLEVEMKVGLMIGLGVGGLGLTGLLAYWDHQIGLAVLGTAAGLLGVMLVHAIQLSLTGSAWRALLPGVAIAVSPYVHFASAGFAGDQQSVAG